MMARGRRNPVMCPELVRGHVCSGCSETVYEMVPPRAGHHVRVVCRLCGRASEQVPGFGIRGAVRWMRDHLVDSHVGIRLTHEGRQ